MTVPIGHSGSSRIVFLLNFFHLFSTSRNVRYSKGLLCLICTCIYTSHYICVPFLHSTKLLCYMISTFLYCVLKLILLCINDMNNKRFVYYRMYV